MNRWLSVVFLLLCASEGAASELKVPADREPFDAQQLFQGSEATEALCQQVPSSVWVVVEGKGDCIRYFASGLKRSNADVLMWLHGDRLSGTAARGNLKALRYDHVTPGDLHKTVSAWSKHAGLPAIYLGRPGVYGSSGDHKQRRRPREAMLVNAAVDAIKARHHIGQWSLSGQSGGGGLVAALLGLRDDIRCAAMSSGAIAVAERIRQLGKKGVDTTGYTDFLDPITLIDRIPSRPDLRMFVLSDPRDKDVPYASQRAWVNAAATRGLKPVQIFGQAKPPLFHGLDEDGRMAATLCAQNAGDADILAALNKPF